MVGTEVRRLESSPPKTAPEVPFYSGRDRRRSGDLTLFRREDLVHRSAQRGRPTPLCPPQLVGTSRVAAGLRSASCRRSARSRPLKYLRLGPTPAHSPIDPRTAARSDHSDAIAPLILKESPAQSGAEHLCGRVLRDAPGLFPEWRKCPQRAHQPSTSLDCQRVGGPAAGGPAVAGM